MISNIVSIIYPGYKTKGTILSAYRLCTNNPLSFYPKLFLRWCLCKTLRSRWTTMLFMLEEPFSLNVHRTFRKWRSLCCENDFWESKLVLKRLLRGHLGLKMVIFLCTVNCCTDLKCSVLPAQYRWVWTSVHPPLQSQSLAHLRPGLEASSHFYCFLWWEKTHMNTWTHKHTL